jgi:hypothetical protein
MKRKWTPYPANIWDAETVERWLEDEAARGWRLDGSRQWGRGLVRLLRTEPAVCRVRVQPVGFVSQEAWQERLETFRNWAGPSAPRSTGIFTWRRSTVTTPPSDWTRIWRSGPWSGGRPLSGGCGRASAWGPGLALLQPGAAGLGVHGGGALMLLAVQALGGVGLTLWAALSVPSSCGCVGRRRQAFGNRPEEAGGGPPGGGGCSPSYWS